MIALIHIKKTAGKSLKHIMRCELGVAHCDVKRWHRQDPYYSAADLRRLLKVYPWLQSIAGHSIRPYSDLRRDFPDLRYYTFLRDPLKRCVSEYQYSVRKGRCPPDSFDAWIREPRFRNVQVQSLAGAQDLDRAVALLEDEIAFVGLMERFDESLRLMPPVLNLLRIAPRKKRVNAASDQGIRDRVLADPGAMRACREANQLDSVLYRHAQRIYARQKQAALATDATLGRARPSQRQFNRRFWTNGAYRQAVYKPVIWAYRSVQDRPGRKLGVDTDR